MSKSNFAEAEILNLVYRGVGTLPAGPFEVALFTADPGEDASGAEVDTAVWTNYARQSISKASGSWAAPSSEAGGGQLIDNASVIDFGTASVTGTAPVVSHVGIFDESGNLWHYGALSSSKTINDGDPVSFPAGDLDLIER